MVGNHVAYDNGGGSYGFFAIRSKRVLGKRYLHNPFLNIIWHVNRVFHLVGRAVVKKLKFIRVVET